MKIKQYVQYFVRKISSFCYEKFFNTGHSWPFSAPLIFRIIIMNNSITCKPVKGKPGFIAKLQAILSNQQFSGTISWSCSGNSFLIFDVSMFQSRVLGSYFRHKRISSFIRQLNMYGFHKERAEKEALEFYHPFFQKDRPDLLAFIERKKVSELSFKENQQDCRSKEFHSEAYFSHKYMPSIKMIQPESQWNNEPSFRFNGSKMTIRLNQALTSLYDVEFDEDVNQLIQMGCVNGSLSDEKDHQEEKNGENEICLEGRTAKKNEQCFL